MFTSLKWTQPVWETRVAYFFLGGTSVKISSTEPNPLTQFAPANWGNRQKVPLNDEFDPDSSTFGESLY